MAQISSKPERFILHSIIPLLCSMALGLLFYQDEIFQRQLPAFQFVWSALFMSLLYNLIRDVRPRDAKLGLAILALLTMLTTHSTRPMYIVRDLFYIAGMAASVALYARYYTQTATAPMLASAVTFAGLYGMMNIATMACDLLMVKVFSVENTNIGFRQILPSASSFAILIGFGLGAGFELAERYPRTIPSAPVDRAAQEGNLPVGT